jgi:butyryl-CoA dehydrogenase
MSATDLDEQQNLLVDSARRYVERGYGEPQRRQSLQHAQGCDPARWQELADMGWLALPLRESRGGLGGSLIDVCLIAEELGRGLVVEPYVGCAVLAATLLDDAADDGQAARWLPALAAGEKRIAVAAWERAARFDPMAGAARAAPEREGYRIDGNKTLALGAPGADTFLVSAKLPPASPSAAPIALFMIDAKTTGLSLHPYPLYDGRMAADLRLNNVWIPADCRIATDRDAKPLFERAFDQAIVAHCAESVGAMACAFDITLQYLKTRHQFGKAIAANQAIQHRLVDLYVAIEEARALTRAAARGFDQSAEAGGRLAAAAKAYVSQAAQLVWKETVQLHGAIGMTDEYILGSYVKRLAAAATLYGDAEYHLERLAQAEDRLRPIERPAPQAMRESQS